MVEGLMERPGRDDGPMTIAPGAPTPSTTVEAARRAGDRPNGAAAHAEPPPALVELREVSKRYGRLYALRNVDLSIAPGEFVFVIGPSEAGKSTLLKLMHGDLRASWGRVRVFDYRLYRRWRRFLPRLRRQVAAVFQEHRLLPRRRDGGGGDARSRPGVKPPAPGRRAPPGPDRLRPARPGRDPARRRAGAAGRAARAHRAGARRAGRPRVAARARLRAAAAPARAAVPAPAAAPRAGGRRGSARARAPHPPAAQPRQGVAAERSLAGARRGAGPAGQPRGTAPPPPPPPPRGTGAPPP